MKRCPSHVHSRKKRQATHEIHLDGRTWHFQIGRWHFELLPARPICWTGPNRFPTEQRAQVPLATGSRWEGKNPGIVGNRLMQEAELRL